MDEQTGEDITKGIRKRYLIIVILCFSVMLFGIFFADFLIQFAVSEAWADWKN